MSFAKTQDRSGKALEPEPQIDENDSIQAREMVLEDYLSSRVKNFFSERSLSWNFATAGRSLANAIPDDVKESVRSLIVEGRSKKKILKKLLPLLGLLKLKLAGLAVLAIAGIALIAKKALITSLIAIALAGAGALSGIVSKLFSLGRGVGGSGLGGGLGAGLGGGLGGGLSALGGLGGGGSSHGGSNVEEIIAYNT